MNVKSILVFIGGLAVGTAAGVITTKKYFEEKYQQRYEEDRDQLEDYYQTIDEYARVQHDIDDLDDDEVDTIDLDISRSGGRMSPEERLEIKGKLEKNWQGTTNYAGMYDKNDQNDDGSETDQEPEPTPEEENFNEHQKNKNRPPKIISEDAYSNLPQGVDTGVLYYFAYDETLCDENEEPIEDEKRFIGDALDKYGFRDNDERLIFVMNYELETAYEIQKVDANWTETH